MVVHTSHYAAVGAVASEAIAAVMSTYCGVPVDAGILANPATISLAVVAVIDVVVRHFKEVAIAKINPTAKKSE